MTMLTIHSVYSGNSYSVFNLTSDHFPAQYLTEPIYVRTKAAHFSGMCISVFQQRLPEGAMSVRFSPWPINNHLKVSFKSTTNLEISCPMLIFALSPSGKKLDQFQNLITWSLAKAYPSTKFHPN